MSDINDLIARTTIMAFNEGLETGKARAKDRIVLLLESYKDSTPEELIQKIEEEVQ